MGTIWDGPSKVGPCWSLHLALLLVLQFSQKSDLNPFTLPHLKALHILCPNGELPSWWGIPDFSNMDNHSFYWSRPALSNMVATQSYIRAKEYLDFGGSKLKHTVLGWKTKATWCHFYVESKIWHKWSYLQNRNKSWTWRADLCLPGRRGEEGINREFGVGRCKLLHLEPISNEVLQYITGNCVQSLGLEHDGR